MSVARRLLLTIKDALLFLVLFIFLLPILCITALEDDDTEIEIAAMLLLPALCVISLI